MGGLWLTFMTKIVDSYEISFIKSNIKFEFFQSIEFTCVFVVNDRLQFIIVMGKCRFHRSEC